MTKPPPQDDDLDDPKEMALATALMPQPKDLGNMLFFLREIRDRAVGDEEGTYNHEKEVLKLCFMPELVLDGSMPTDMTSRFDELAVACHTALYSSHAKTSDTAIYDDGYGHEEAWQRVRESIEQDERKYRRAIGILKALQDRNWKFINSDNLQFLLDTLNYGIRANQENAHQNRQEARDSDAYENDHLRVHVQEIYDLVHNHAVNGRHIKIDSAEDFLPHRPKWLPEGVFLDLAREAMKPEYPTPPSLVVSDCSSAEYDRLLEVYVTKGGTKLGELKDIISDAIEPHLPQIPYQHYANVNEDAAQEYEKMATLCMAGKQTLLDVAKGLGIPLTAGITGP